MPIIKIIGEQDLRGCVVLDAETVQCVEDCFRTLATEAVVMPPIMRIDIHEHNGEVDAKAAYLPGLDSLAVKISSGFFNNPGLGLPSTGGMMNLFSSSTGQLEAVLLDNGYLTDVRTAAAGAVAAKWLSRENAASAAVIGAGMQAGLQLQALMLVRPVTAASVWARDADKAERFAAEMSGKLGIEVTTAGSVGEAVAGRDVVITCTPSSEPLVLAEHLSPGQHVTAMGSDAEHKNEIHPDALKRADGYYCDRLSQVEILGELRAAIEAGVMSTADIAGELGDVIAGRASGRDSDDDITICDLTGTGAQDTAIATLARRKAQAAGLGIDFDS